MLDLTVKPKREFSADLFKNSREQFLAGRSVFAHHQVKNGALTSVKLTLELKKIGQGNPMINSVTVTETGSINGNPIEISQEQTKEYQDFLTKLINDSQSTCDEDVLKMKFIITLKSENIVKRIKESDGRTLKHWQFLKHKTFFALQTLPTCRLSIWPFKKAGKPHQRSAGVAACFTRWIARDRLLKPKSEPIRWKGAKAAGVPRR